MTEAAVILRICNRFSCTPREAEKQDAGVLRLLDIEDIKGWRRAEGGE